MNKLSNNSMNNVMNDVDRCMHKTKEPMFKQAHSKMCEICINVCDIVRHQK